MAQSLARHSQRLASAWQQNPDLRCWANQYDLSKRPKCFCDGPPKMREPWTHRSSSSQGRTGSHTCMASQLRAFLVQPTGNSFPSHHEARAGTCRTVQARQFTQGARTRSPVIRARNDLPRWLSKQGAAVASKVADHPPIVKYTQAHARASVNCCVPVHKQHCKGHLHTCT